MSAVLIHHYPLYRETRSSLSVVLIAFLVSPVANDPTNGLNICLAIGIGFGLFILLWIRFWFSISDQTESSQALSTNSMMNSESKQYHEINANINTEVKCNTTDNDFVGLESGNNNDNDTDNDLQSELALVDMSSDRKYFIDRDPAERGNQKWDKTSIFICQHSLCVQYGPKLYLTIIGFIMIIIAFACYIFQNRETYWIVHSVWHVLAMGSTFCFIKNRDTIVHLISNVLANKTFRDKS